ncbi:MAG: thioredoxin family protein [Desulfovibrionaceae bacterium]|nr:thioredoxin family protein [Desulfovibrionaceae bacterium]
MPLAFRVEWGGLAEQECAALQIPGSGCVVAVLWLIPEEGYHTYAHKPGGGAMPTTIEAHGAEIRYLPGVPQPDMFDPDTTVRVYEGPTPVFLLFTRQSLPAHPEASVSLLACSSRNCFPVRTTLALGVPPSPGLMSLSERPAWLADLFRARSDEQAAAGAHEPMHSAGAYFPVSGMEVQGQLKGPSDSALNTQSSFPDEMDAAWNLEPRALQAGLEVRGLGKALLFGLLAGLILNIMPCVLPVLMLKVSPLLAAEADADQRIRAFREHALLFSAGILTWFAALALLFGVAGMVWGQLFQSSAVVFAMLLLVFVLGLSMFDVFHLPVLDICGKNSAANPRLNAYCAGLLATLLSTPCSGPLLGGVLGWSLGQTLPILMTVFLATGLGMALPYLLMAVKPGMAAVLPRPGNWMLSFQRVLGFFLMGTGLYLLSILPVSMHMPSLAVLLAAAVAAWVWGRWGAARDTVPQRLAIGAGGLAVVGLSIWMSFAPAAPGMEWQAFRAESFRGMLGTRPILVEFTADWCPTCKVLEHSVLTDDMLKSLVERYGLTLVRADLTRGDAQAHALLRALNSASIPVLAIFPEGEGWKSPVVLRDLYTAGQLEEAARQALHP